MSFLCKSVKLYNISRTWRAVAINSKCFMHNYDDYKPGPYPKTQAEREAAAKKYNLLPSEYEPYPDDGLGRGDYPMLPFESVESRDPTYNWTDPVLRRNFGEPVHDNINMYSQDRYNISFRPRFSVGVMLSSFFGVVFSSFAIYLFFENYKIDRPVMEKQYPKPGTIHYTFETSESNTDAILATVSHPFFKLKWVPRIDKDKVRSIFLHNLRSNLQRTPQKKGQSSSDLNAYYHFKGEEESAESSDEAGVEIEGLQYLKEKTEAAA